MFDWFKDEATLRREAKVAAKEAVDDLFRKQKQIKEDADKASEELVVKQEANKRIDTMVGQRNINAKSAIEPPRKKETYRSNSEPIFANGVLPIGCEAKKVIRVASAIVPPKKIQD